MKIPRFSIKPIIKKKKGTLVLEIGREYLKALIYQKNREKIIFERFFHKELKEISEVADILTKEEIDYENMIIILSREQVFARNLELPTVDPTEIKDIVEIQAVKQTPLVSEEIISDYKVVGSKQEHYTKVLLSIAKKEIIDQVVSNFSDKIEKIQYIGLSSDCLAGLTPSIEKQTGTTTLGIIYVEGDVCEFSIINFGYLTLTRLLQIDGDAFEKEDWVANLFAEIKCTLELYQSDGIGPYFENIIFLGDEKRTQDIFNKVSTTQLDKEEYGLNNVKFGLFLFPEEDDTHSFTVEAQLGLKSKTTKDNSFLPLLGAALAGEKTHFDYLPQDTKDTRKNTKQRQEFVVTAVLASFLALSLMGVFLEKIFAQNLILGKLNGELKRIETQTIKLKQEKEKVKLIKERMKIETSPIEVLKQVFTVVPQTVFLVAITYDSNEKVALRGSASAATDVVDFVNTLEEIKIFEGVQTGYLNNREVKGKEYVDFEVICPIVE